MNPAAQKPESAERVVLGVDIGGTNTKFGEVILLPSKLTNCNTAIQEAGALIWNFLSKNK